MEILSEHKAFGGKVAYHQHASEACRCDMRFSSFVPAGSAQSLPIVWWLSGLTCTEDNFTVKAGAQRVASELGLILIVPDTSPRGENVPDEEGYDIGQGAGFYLDATQSPWNTHFNMYSYITRELPKLVFDEFSADKNRQGIMGHSMGGHGALTIWLKNPDIYRSVSAFAPICAPTKCPWGEKAFSTYLGPDEESWGNYDACELLQAKGDGAWRPEILVDQGLSDDFLEQQLKPQLLESACATVNQKLNLRRHDNYDHSYFFIASFIEDHLHHHAALLNS